MSRKRKQYKTKRLNYRPLNQSSINQRVVKCTIQALCYISLEPLPENHSMVYYSRKVGYLGILPKYVLS